MVRWKEAMVIAKIERPDLKDKELKEAARIVFHRKNIIETPLIIYMITAAAIVLSLIAICRIT